LNKIVSIKETSAIFLAIVLVVGTIALAVPSFSVEAQATSDRDKDYYNDDRKDSYEKERDYKSSDRDERDYDRYDNKKSYDKDDYKSEYSSYGKYEDRDHDKYKKESNSSVNIKKVKCNNVNVNLNGIDVNIGLPNNEPITEPISVAEEDYDEEIESNSIESDKDESYEGKEGKSDFGTDSRIVCINNNNNIVIEESPEQLSCEECFTENLNDEQLENLTSVLTLTAVEDLEGLCESLSDPTISNQEKFNGLAIIFSVAEITDEDAFLSS